MNPQGFKEQSAYDREEMLLDMHEKVTQIHTALYGVPGTDEKGMCGRVNKLEIDYNRFKGNIIKVAFVLVASGVITGAGIGIDKLVVLLTG